MLKVGARNRQNVQFVRFVAVRNNAETRPEQTENTSETTLSRGGSFVRLRDSRSHPVFVFWTVLGTKWLRVNGQQSRSRRSDVGGTGGCSRRHSARFFARLRFVAGFFPVCSLPSSLFCF